MAIPPQSQLAQDKSTELATKVGTMATQVTPILQGPAAEEQLTTEGVLVEDRPEAVTPTTIDPTSFAPLQAPEKFEDAGQITTAAHAISGSDGNRCYPRTRRTSYDTLPVV